MSDRQLELEINDAGDSVGQILAYREHLLIRCAPPVHSPDWANVKARLFSVHARFL